MDKQKSKYLYALKQKAITTTSYDPEEEQITSLINNFRLYLKDAKFIKSYSELEIFEFYKEIHWMKSVDEKLSETILTFAKKQSKLKAKYENYIEYKYWSESPLAESAKPLSQVKRIVIISIVVLIFIAMLLIILGLNKGWFKIK